MTPKRTLRERWFAADEATRRKRLVSILSVAFFIALSVALCLTVGRQMVRFASDGAAFRAWVQSHGFWGKMAYIGIVAAQIVVAIIPGEPVELAGGYAFGAWQGLLLAEIGILLASSLVFLLVKRFGTAAVEAFIPREKIESFRFLQDSARRNAIVFLLFFIPGTPKDVLTYFVGLTPMRLGEWLLITSVARVPSVLSSTIVGAAAGESDWRTAIIVYAVTGVLSAAGALYYRHFTKRHAKG